MVVPARSTREALYATQKELGPISDWFDKEEPDPTSQTLNSDVEKNDADDVMELVERTDENTEQDEELQLSLERPQKTRRIYEDSE
jgi:hypothetical protein